tara:strand:+ start:316 stop:492 length:177 start_codon:yes stop_codon:yes gene_type:complete
LENTKIKIGETMKKYTFKVTIEGMNGYLTYTVEANSKDEAVQKAYDDAEGLPKIVYDV